MGVGGQHHAPAALPPVKTRYQLYRRLVRPQGRSGRVRKISTPTEIRSLVQPLASRYTDWWRVQIACEVPHYAFSCVLLLAFDVNILAILFLNILNMCTVHSQYVYLTFSICVPYLLNMCTVHSQYVYRTFSICVPYILSMCTVHSPVGDRPSIITSKIIPL